MPPAVRTPSRNGLSGLPPQFITVIRPELPSLFLEIIEEIRQQLPEYAHARDSPYDRALRTGVERSLDGFTQWVAAPKASTGHYEEVHRLLGRQEALEGRRLDTLQTAYRIGGRVAWRRAMKVGEQRKLSSQTMIVFADALFAYIDELSSHARAGYLETAVKGSVDREEARRRLMRMLVSDAPTSMSAITAVAERAGWTVPETVTPVALKAGAAPQDIEVDDDVLVDADDIQPYVLFPGPLDDQRRAALLDAAAGSRAGVGLCVPLAAAPDALRWARQALRLAESGVIRADSLVLCEEHLIALWLMRDPALLEEIATRQLAPLSSVTPGRRYRLTETLRVWLTTRGTAAKMAEVLNVHPQTVRYRLRVIDQLVGAQVSDDEQRFALEAALRALHLQEEGDVEGKRPARSARRPRRLPESSA